jgi:hypothetical protein
MFEKSDRGWDGWGINNFIELVSTAHREKKRERKTEISIYNLIGN